MSGRPSTVLAAAQRAAAVRLGEARVGGQVVAPRVDVLAEQRDLRQPAAARRARLGDDVVEGPAALGAARERHDAVGAGLVAAVDDGQPGAATPRRRAMRPATAPARVAGSRSAVAATLRPTRAMTDAPSSPGPVGAGEAESRRQLGLLVRPQEEVDRRVASLQRGLVVGAHRAAGEHDAQARVGRLESRRTPMRPMTFCSAASRIEQVLMTMRSAVSSRRASAQPAASSAPAISSESERVHLAAQRPDVEARLHGVLDGELGESRYAPAAPDAAVETGAGRPRGRAGRSQAHGGRTWAAGGRQVSAAACHDPMVASSPSRQKTTRRTCPPVTRGYTAARGDAGCPTGRRLAHRHPLLPLAPRRLPGRPALRGEPHRRRARRGRPAAPRRPGGRDDRAWSSSRGSLR